MNPFDIVMPLLKIVAIFVSLTHAAPDSSEIRRSAEPPAPIELTRQQIEAELAGLIHRQEVAFPPPDPDEFREAVMKRAIPHFTFYSEGNFGGVILSANTIAFDGCALVERLKRPNQTSGKLVTVIEKRLHLAFLDTYPPRIEVTPSLGGSPGQEAMVWFEFRSDIRNRLNKLNQKVSDIRNEAYERFPQNVPERYVWLKEQYDTNLIDKIYLNASETSYGDVGTAVTFPLHSPQLLNVPLMQAERFIYLLDSYRTRYCDNDPVIEP